MDHFRRSNQICAKQNCEINIKFVNGLDLLYKQPVVSKLEKQNVVACKRY